MAGLRAAKDIAENNPDSSVLLATSDTTITGFKVEDPNEGLMSRTYMACKWEQDPCVTLVRKCSYLFFVISFSTLNQYL